MKYCITMTTEHSLVLQADVRKPDVFGGDAHACDVLICFILGLVIPSQTVVTPLLTEREKHSQ